MNSNDLPIEMWEIIFDQLPLAQRIRCRLVNKKWLFIVDNLKPKSLVLTSPKLSKPVRRPFTSELVKLDNHLVKNDPCFEMMFSMKMFNNLKRLYFSEHVSITTREVETCLNRLVNLKELTVNVVKPSSVPSNCKISLPSLETLEIYLDRDIFCELNTPSLTKIHSRSDFPKFTFCHPEKMNTIWASGTVRDNFAPFINLQFISLNFLPNSDTNPLLSLPNLKELNFSDCPEFLNRRYMSKQVLLDFAEKLKKKSKSKDLKIFFGGFLLQDAELSDCNYSGSLGGISQDEMCSYLENLGNLSDILPAERLDLEDGSFRNIADRVPKGFFRKFIHLRQLYLSDVIDQDSTLEAKLVQMLDDCRFILKFRFLKCPLSDHFWWKVLPRKYPFLQMLIISKCRTKSFDFLFEFSSLTLIHIDRLSADSGVDFIKRVFQQLKFMKSFRFEYNERLYFNIVFKEESGFNYRSNSQNFTHFENLDNLLACISDRANGVC